MSALRAEDQSKYQRNRLISSFPRKRESTEAVPQRSPWTRAFAGVTTTVCETCFKSSNFSRGVDRDRQHYREKDREIEGVEGLTEPGRPRDGPLVFRRLFASQYRLDAGSNRPLGSQEPRIRHTSGRTRLGVDSL